MALVAVERIEKALGMAMTIAGARAAALVDLHSGMTMEMTTDGLCDIDRASEHNAEVVRAKQRVQQAFKIKDDIEDILITLTTQHHLIRVLNADSGLFIYVILDRAETNLAMARVTLYKIDRAFARAERERVREALVA